MVQTHHVTKSISAKNIQRKWHVIDLKGKILGRTATQIAQFLQGKHKVEYVPYLDMGDYVVAINAREVAVTGSKELNKTYTYFSGYPSGLREVSLQRLRETKPEEIIRRAVIGKLPKNKQRDRRMARLLVYPGESHPHMDKITSAK